MSEDDALKVMAGLFHPLKGRETMLSLEPWTKRLGGATLFSRAFHEAFRRSIPEVMLVVGAAYPELVDPELMELNRQFFINLAQKMNELGQAGISDIRTAAKRATVLLTSSPMYQQWVTQYREKMLTDMAWIYRFASGEIVQRDLYGLPTYIEACVQHWYEYWGAQEREYRRLPPVPTTTPQAAPQVLR